MIYFLFQEEEGEAEEMKILHHPRLLLHRALVCGPCLLYINDLINGVGSNRRT